jgi:cbb3-type cytochrome oxidase subunit 3
LFEDVAMSLLWGTIVFLAAIVWAITIYDILRRHLGGKKTVLWLLLVIVLPFIGALIYWALRKPEPEELQQTVVAERALREDAAARSIDSRRTGV